MNLEEEGPSKIGPSFFGSTLNVGVFTQFNQKKGTQSPISFILEMSSNK